MKVSADEFFAMLADEKDVTFRDSDQNGGGPYPPVPGFMVHDADGNLIGRAYLSDGAYVFEVK